VKNVHGTTDKPMNLLLLLIVEEAYEVLDAIHKKEDKEFAKELGDLFLHIVMHSVNG
jgi:NTP pyrophosphatase (non-canonical NTP hydrolase)